MTNDLLDLIETVNAEEATTQRMFADAGRGVRSMRRSDPRYLQSLTEAARLIGSVYDGRIPMYRLQEAMSTSDFPLLFGDVIDRSMLGKYREWPSTWAQLARRGSVRDFRTVRKFVTDGAEAILTPVKQGEEYTEAKIDEAKYDYSVAKYGRRLPFFWEAFVNDDLDALRDAPDRLAKASRMSEEKFATALYAAATGPNATFFHAANNKNLVTAGAGSALSTTSLQDAFKLLWAQVDKDGNPVFSGQVRLVVPPHLAVTARNIINATEIRVAGGSGSATTDQLVAKNWMAQEIVDLVVNPWLPIVTTTGTIGTTAWYLFADPGIGRPAMEVGFLRGHEAPELFLKSPNATRIGGGAVAAEDGDFDTDAVNYKVRHVFGGTLLEPKAAVASFGQ